MTTICQCIAAKNDPKAIGKTGIKRYTALGCYFLLLEEL
jgi:hypothetical protein